MRLPKNVRNPVIASFGYSVSGSAASANQPANKMKLIESSFPVCGKLKDAGTRTSGSSVADGETGGGSWFVGRKRSDYI